MNTVACDQRTVAMFGRGIGGIVVCVSVKRVGQVCERVCAHTRFVCCSSDIGIWLAWRQRSRKPQGQRAAPRVRT